MCGLARVAELCALRLHRADGGRLEGVFISLPKRYRDRLHPDDSHHILRRHATAEPDGADCKASRRSSIVRLTVLTIEATCRIDARCPCPSASQAHSSPPQTSCMN